jgi:hypothetical protein
VKAPKGTVSEKLGPRTKLSEKPGEHGCSEGVYGRAEENSKGLMAAIPEEIRPTKKGIRVCKS